MIIIQLRNHIFCLDEKQFQVSLGEPTSPTEEAGTYVPASWDELVNRIESCPDITVQVIYYNGRFLHNTARWFGNPDSFTVNYDDNIDIDFISGQLVRICGCEITEIGAEEA